MSNPKIKYALVAFEKKILIDYYEKMGEFVNAPWLRVAGWAAAALITVLNVLLIVLVIAGG